MEEVYIDTIAYMEKQGRWAQIIATFADEELYDRDWETPFEKLW